MKNTDTPTQHSPGNWFHGEPFQFDDKDFEHRHRVFIGIGNGAEHIGYASVTGCVPVETAMANAKLMTAAPALLAACEIALYRLVTLEDAEEANPNDKKAIRTLKSAIAQARGEA